MVASFSSSGNSSDQSPQSSFSTACSSLRIRPGSAIYQDVPVVCFVQQVWGLDTEKIDTISATALKLDKGSLSAYKSILMSEESFDTGLLHQPFRVMTRDLLKDICRLFPNDDPKPSTYLWDGKKRFIMSGKIHKTSRQRPRNPDLLDVYVPIFGDGLVFDPDELPRPTNAPTPTWGEIRAIFEFNKEELSCIDDVAEESEATLETENSVSPAASPTSGASAKAGAKRCRSCGTDCESIDSDGRLRKKARGETTVTHEITLATYALECLYTGNRHYVTGFFIDGVNITIWYYDRTASMHCSSFDFTTPEGIVNLGLGLFALSQCNMKHSGFDPFLHRFTSPPCGQPILPDAVTTLVKPEVDMTKLCYKFPLLGCEDRIFAVKEVLYRSPSLNGRGSFVTVINEGVVGDTLCETDYILKLSWQESTRCHEGDILARLHRAIPGWSDHLPIPIFHAKIDAADIDLPRTRIRKLLREENITDHLKALEFPDRDLHIFVTNRFKHIWEAESVGEFKRIFLDCVECHYHAWNTGKVLHRDISENNLMIYQPEIRHKDAGDAASDPLDKLEYVPLSRGILNDFDLASELGSDGASVTADQHYDFIGTFPFMAQELLRNKQSAKLELENGAEDKFQTSPEIPLRPKHHLYRYDLESFLYVLIWATTHYDLKNHIRLPSSEVPCLWNWEHPDINVDVTSKIMLILGDGGEMEQIEGSVIEGWEDVWINWVRPLLNIFEDGWIAARSASRHKLADFDFDTCGGEITFEKFMAALGEVPRGLNATTQPRFL
ncbi:hypothetical protein HYPSUDRAFT_1005903 [Hypholoma sublateritium FD-334 SS-4]|uniref:Protein kinase domain-containing protein n=1 Tax=Hypholoma sublateritium (strain FD-334 SS-4) TaxID=945553 RepID=A0A0D2NM51_HYPSF|nr:hypothetical protein HYPSUDRAFT_1005903 [Hypholoma sublateritium FD-334 SS-4]